MTDEAQGTGEAPANKGGRPRTGNTVKPIGVTLPLETLEALRAEAKRQGVPLSRLITVAVERLLADKVEVARAHTPAAAMALRHARAVKLMREAITELEGEGLAPGT